MIYEKITLVLTQDEMDALRKIAQSELRKPKDQAAYMLRKLIAEYSEHLPKPTLTNT